MSVQKKYREQTPREKLVSAKETMMLGNRIAELILNSPEKAAIILTSWIKSGWKSAKNKTGKKEAA